MEVRAVLGTRDRIRAESACEELRTHRIKCDIWEPSMPDIQAPYSGYTAEFNVVIAPEDEERANDVLAAWRRAI